MEGEGSSEFRELEDDVYGAWEEIEHWRHARRKHEAMPEGLWQQATELARRYGIHPISRDLRLNYRALKKRVEALIACEENQANEEDEKDFLELNVSNILGGMQSQGQLELEVERGDGSKLTLRLPGNGSVDVSSLIERYLQGGSCSK